MQHSLREMLHLVFERAMGMNTLSGKQIRHWFQYFPNHYMWSQGIGMAIEMIPWGAAAMGEIDQVGQRLLGREGDNEAWCEEWSRMALKMERRADEAAAKNHTLTAGTYYLHAATYYGYGERYLHLGERKLAVYGQHLRCFSEGMARRHPDAERVEVPYEGTTLPAWFMRGKGTAGGKAPTVVFFNGLDGAKEVGILYADMDAAMEKLKRYTLAGVANKISCPFLVVHGEHDTIVPVDYARRLYEAVGSKNKTLKIFSPDDGGAEHCQGDNRVLGANYVADWLADNL